MKEIYLNEFNILMGDRIYLPSSSGVLRAFSETKKEIRNNYIFYIHVVSFETSFLTTENTERHGKLFI